MTQIEQTAADLRSRYGVAGAALILQHAAIELYVEAHVEFHERMLQVLEVLSIAPAQGQTNPFDYDAWLRSRTERAHREFMERTSSLPRCDGRESLAEKLERYFGDRRY